MNPSSMGNMELPEVTVTAAPHESSDADANPSRRASKILIVSSAVPPAYMGSGVIVGNLLAKLEPGEAVAIAEGSDRQVRYIHGQAAHSFKSEFRWPQRGRRFIRWARWARYRSLVRLIDRVSAETGRGPIVAVFPDEFYASAARAVAKRRGLPFFPYFHNTYTDNRTGLSRVFGKGKEAAIMRDAECVMVLTSALEQHFHSRYPQKKFVVVPHSFAFDGTTELAAKPSDGKIRVGILGNINSSNLDAFLRLFRAIDDSVLVNIYSGATPEWFFKKLGVLGPRVKLQQPSDAELQARLQENDLLFLPHGLSGEWSSVEYRTIFPTRTVTYLGAGKPILAHCPEQSFLYEWLKARDCAEIVSSPNEQALGLAIRTLASNGPRAHEVTQNAARAFTEFNPDVVVAKFKQVLAGEDA